MNSPQKLTPEQLNYMKNVLGIQNVVLPALAPQALESTAEPIAQNLEPVLPSAQSVQNATRLVAFFPLLAESFPLKGEAAELVTKMIRAMKLERVNVLSAEWLHAPQAELPRQIMDLFIQARDVRCPVLIFGFDQAIEFMGPKLKIGEWTEMSGARVIATHSPQDLLKSPDRKKQAWAHLQSVMKDLR